MNTSPAAFTPAQLLEFRKLYNDFFNQVGIEHEQQWSRVALLENTQQKGYSGVYRNYMVKDNKELPVLLHNDLNSYFRLFEAAAATFGEVNCLGSRKFNNTKKGEFDDFYTYETYNQIRERRLNFGAGLVQVVTQHRDYELAIKPNGLDFDGLNNDKPYKFLVLLFSSNRAEWVMADLGCQCYNVVNTALYDTLGAGTTVYILELTKSPVVVASADKILKLLKLKAKHPEALRNFVVIVSMDSLDFKQDYGLYKYAESCGISLYDFHQVEAYGKRSPLPLSPSGWDDIYTVSFTSGTTGMPKGVVLLQKMILASVYFCYTNFSNVDKGVNTFEHEFRTLSFLPLAHIYERQSTSYNLFKGSTIGYPSNVAPQLSLMDDLKALRPHCFLNVPRVFTKIEAAIKDGLNNGGVRGSLVYSAIKARMAKQALADNERGMGIVFKKMVLDKIRAAFGLENCLFMCSGSAPIAVETVQFLKAVFGCGFKQGYGLTESFAGITVSKYFEKDPGNCGVVSTSVEVRLRDLPEMNYVHDSPDGIAKGELMMRGPQMFQSYYKRPEETEKSFDKDGWFHTGDVAKIDKQGRIHVIDRAKNFFKLSQGEYITPERIESIYVSTCPLLTQIFIYGDSFQSYLIAILGVEEGPLLQFLNQNAAKLPKPIRAKLATAKGKDFYNLVNGSPEARKLLVKNMNASVNANKHEGDQSILLGFEKFHNIYVDDMPLKIEDDVVTPTMKLKRAKASFHFKSVITDLYSEGSLVKGAKF